MNASVTSLPELLANSPDHIQGDADLQMVPHRVSRPGRRRRLKFGYGYQHEAQLPEISTFMEGIVLLNTLQRKISLASGKDSDLDIFKITFHYSNMPGNS